MFQRMIFGTNCAGKRRIGRRAPGLAHESLEGRMLLTADLGSELLVTAEIGTVDPVFVESTTTGIAPGTVAPSIPEGELPPVEFSPTAENSLAAGINYGTLTKKDPVIILTG